MAQMSAPDGKKRRFLVAATSVVGAVGAAFVATPFLVSMSPSQRAKAAGAPVEVDISKLEPGMLITVEWRGRPVWVLRRTKEMLESLTKDTDKIADPDSEQPLQPDYARNPTRSIKPEVMVMVGICSHLGCSPSEKLKIGPDSGLGDDWPGGFLCPCHGSKFDLAGRVFKGMPAPVNLTVPPYMYLTDSRLLIGEDKKGA
ncbi:MAG: ubiquinol-cytochrome c reductase iron-sulfur subunit [Betaproteobacteria bacterium]|nr:ubiquinol-cytochrome c reductase iron-sulfur subunit [Betaproteobacteria bacterium]